MNKPLLSIIVPCYNVASFLPRCIESLIKQTYVNVEILLIDDGSTDDTPILCDQYAKVDSRVKVIHQENHGSSASREIGLKHIKGDFVTFVDADDWVHPDMYSIMTQDLIESKADIAQCGVCDTYIHTYGNESQIEYKHRITDKITSDYQIYNKISGVLKILDDKEWQSYMWNKIYRKKLFDNIQFPKGRGLDEDLSVMHLIFHNASSSIYINSEFYYYLHREGSICSSIDKASLVKKTIDRNTARWERYQFTLSHEEYHEMLCKMQNIVVSVGLQSLRFIYKNQSFFDKQFISTLKNRLLSLSKIKLMPEFFYKMKKIEWFLFRYSFPLYYFAVKKLNIN